MNTVNVILPIFHIEYSCNFINTNSHMCMRLCLVTSNRRNIEDRKIKHKRSLEWVHMPMPTTITFFWNSLLDIKMALIGDMQCTTWSPTLSLNRWNLNWLQPITLLADWWNQSQQFVQEIHNHCEIMLNDMTQTWHK